MNYYLGVDIGTSSVKTLAITAEGKTIARFSEDLSILTPKKGDQEQDPELILDAVISVLTKAIIEIKEQPLGISFSSAMHGLICVDAEGKLLTNCWLWSDARSVEVADSLGKNELGGLIFAATGTPIHPMSPLCKIRWLQENQADVHAKTACFFDIKSYLIWRLFGEKVIDFSMASATGLFSAEIMTWDKQALDFCSISEKQVPKPVSTFYKLPSLKEEFVKKTGISVQVPFIISGSDGCLANLGAGALNKGVAALTIGTSAAIRTTSATFSTAKTGSLFTYILEENNYLIGGASNNGGNVMEWFTKKVAKKKSIENLFNKTTKIPAGAEGLTFFPYVFGERAPLWDANASGMYCGVSASHGQLHFAKATIEGILFNLRLILEEIEKTTGQSIEKIVAGGGFFRSKVGTQLAADILGKTVEIRESHDNSAYGAVLQLMKGLGHIADYSEKKDWWQKGKIFTPNPTQTQLYKLLFTKYQTIQTRNY